MSRIIGLEELQQLCYDAWTYSLDLPSGNADVYQLLLRGGFRWLEVFELTRWELVSPGNWEIQAAKGGNKRAWLEVNIPVFYLACLQSDMTTFPYARYSTFNRTLRRTVPQYPIWNGDKNVTSHIFRYNRVKELYDQGQTVQQISDYLGEVDNDNTQGYIDAELSTDYPI